VLSRFIHFMRGGQLASSGGSFLICQQLIPDKIGQQPAQRRPGRGGVGGGKEQLSDGLL
jgi:hypothetical protein